MRLSTAAAAAAAAAIGTAFASIALLLRAWLFAAADGCGAVACMLVRMVANKQLCERCRSAAVLVEYQQQRIYPFPGVSGGLFAHCLLPMFLCCHRRLVCSHFLHQCRQHCQHLSYDLRFTAQHMLCLFGFFWSSILFAPVPPAAHTHCILLYSY